MPINTSIKIEKNDKKEFEPLPNGIYQAELIDVETRETAGFTNGKKDESKRENKLFFTFGIVEDGENRARRLWDNFVSTGLYTTKKGEKCNLWQILEAFLGHELTNEEMATFDENTLNGFIGKQVAIFTTTVEKGGKKYSNPKAYMTAKTVMTALTAEEKVIKPKEEKADNSDPTTEEVSVDSIPF